MSRRRWKLKARADRKRGAFLAAFMSAEKPIARATTRAIREVADEAKAGARANIAAAGFSRRWQNALRADAYRLEQGAVLAYQRDAGFTGRDLDDVPGPRTRTAMHGDLEAAERLAFGPAVPPANLLSEIVGIRDLVVEAGRRLDAIMEWKGA